MKNLSFDIESMAKAGWTAYGNYKEGSCGETYQNVYLKDFFRLLARIVANILWFDSGSCRSSLEARIAPVIYLIYTQGTDLGRYGTSKELREIWFKVVKAMIDAAYGIT